MGMDYIMLDSGHTQVSQIMDTQFEKLNKGILYVAKWWGPLSSKSWRIHWLPIDQQNGNHFNINMDDVRGQLMTLPRR